MSDIVNILATDPFQFHDNRTLSRHFQIHIEGQQLTVDNTAESNGLDFTFEESDKVEVIIQRSYAFVMKMAGETLQLSILNIGIDQSIRVLEYSWDRAQCGLPKRDRSDDFYWPSYIALLLVSDTNNGSSTFHSPYIHHIGFIMRKIANRAGKLPLVREFEKSNLKFTLLNGSFNITDFNDNLLFVTSDFRKLDSGLISHLIYRAMLKTA